MGCGRLSWRSFACTDGRMAEIYQGSCLCAKVRFELIGPPKAVSHCHCSHCRKGHGALFASYGSVPRSALRVLEGFSQIKAYASSQKVVREFCMECGSTLFWSRSHGEFAGWVSIALGTLDTPFIPHKQKHVHADAAAHWYTPASDWGRMQPKVNVRCGSTAASRDWPLSSYCSRSRKPGRSVPAG